MEISLLKAECQRMSEEIKRLKDRNKQQAQRLIEMENFIKVLRNTN